MRSLNVSEFRQQLLSLLEHLPPDGILITKRGKPVARLLPAHKPKKDWIGSLRGKIQINGDLLSTGLKWDAES